MMNGSGKSDRSVVPRKPANKAAKAVAEPVEGRDLAKGNTDGETRPGHRADMDAPSELDRVREAARRNKETRFTALLHHVTIDRLRGAFLALRRDAAPGVDGVTWEQYAEGLEEKLADLHARLHRGAYRARPSRRNRGFEGRIRSGPYCGVSPPAVGDRAPTVGWTLSPPAPRSTCRG